MKYVILIHSNPQPWGHPTGDFLVENTGRPQQERDADNASFDELLTELSKNGELTGGGALGDPAQAHLYRRRNDEVVATDGPYSETKEHFAGFFLLDVDSPARAQEIAEQFSGPGETVELRPMA